jgi:hypothetical protein
MLAKPGLGAPEKEDSDYEMETKDDYSLRG